jgi:hypothetical protein
MCIYLVPPRGICFKARYDTLSPRRLYCELLLKHTPQTIGSRLEAEKWTKEVILGQKDNGGSRIGSAITLAVPVVRRSSQFITDQGGEIRFSVLPRLVIGFVNCILTLCGNTLGREEYGVKSRDILPADVRQDMHGQETPRA